MAHPPALAAVAKAMRGHARTFRVPASHVKTLRHPSEFFESVMDGVQTAKRRVFVASLYLGTNTTRERALADALGEAARTTGGPQVSVLLDALRGTRPTHRSGETPASSAHFVARRVLHGSGDAARAFLYRTPGARGVLSHVLPNRLVEVLGVCHIKAADATRDFVSR